MEPEPERLALHLRRLRLRHLEVLLAVARSGSLTAAAEVLGATQPAVSQWLAEIEAAVGCTLFVRGRQLKPAPPLEPVLRHARRVLADARRLQDELAALAQGAQGLVRIGCMPVASAELLPRALLRLRAEGAALRLEVTEDTAQGLWERFGRRELDLLVGRLDQRAYAPQVQALALYAEAHGVVARRRHPLLRGRLDWARALGFPWVLPPRGTELRRAVEATLLDQGLALPDPWLECAAPTLVQRLLQQSDALAVVSGAAARYYAELGALAVLPLQLKHDVGPVGLAWARGDDSPALRQVAQALEREAQAARGEAAARRRQPAAAGAGRR